MASPGLEGSDGLEVILVSGGVVSAGGEGLFLLPEQLKAGPLKACGSIADDAAKPSRLLGSMEMDKAIIPRKITQNGHILFIFAPLNPREEKIFWLE